MKHLPWRETALALAAIVVVAVCYAAGYLLTVDRGIAATFPGGAPVVVADYHGRTALARFFYLAHQVDRQLRPPYWAGDDLFHDDAP
jgi:hypothetical protein